MTRYIIHVEEHSFRTGVYSVEADSEEDAQYEFETDYNNDLNTEWEGSNIEFNTSYIEVAS